jgi:prophage antirepressor-like protein
MSDIFITLNENYIKFENHIIHIIIDINDEIWFNANQTAFALGYADPKGALKKHVNKKDTKQMYKIKYNEYIKGQPQSLYLNEAGLYSFILLSKMPGAKKFSDWVTHEVLPSIRKYGSYKLKKKYEFQIDKLFEKINYLEKENNKINNELKKEKFPDGGIVYAIDYSDEYDEIYRIGMTGNMTLRKQIYDTHSMYKHKIILYEQTTCPIKLETCIRAMLYDYRYKNRKDFYICDLKYIKKAFKTCLDSIGCMNQKGGNFIVDTNIQSLNNKVNRLKKEIIKLDLILNK